MKNKMKNKKVKTQVEMAYTYLHMMAEEWNKAHRYSWKWERYKRLRLARAHKYAERLKAFFEYGELFSNREAAANYGKNTQAEQIAFWVGIDIFCVKESFDKWCRSHKNFGKHIPSEDVPF